MWGPCTGCPADIYPPCSFAAGYGTVDADDLLLLLGTWGDCPVSCSSGLMMFGGGGGAPQAIQDCIDAAIENGLEGVEFAEFVQQCIENL